ncbi:MAG: ABC transporter ATP-binding protein [Chloroflexota bacterium]
MIQAHHLAKQFGAVNAVTDVTFEVKPGQILAMLGPNGAGKTTSIRMLASLLRPSSGRAVVGGYDTVAEPDRVRMTVGMLTEQPALYGRMDPVDYLRFYGRLYHLDDRLLATRIEELLRYFGIWEHRRRPIGAFSKGMRQKVALSRALVHHPQVVLLDEPTSAMDPSSAKTVRDYILRLRAAGRTVLICTHNLAEAEALADTIAIIAKGRIIAFGAPDALKHQLLGQPQFEIRLTAPVAAPLLNVNGIVHIDATGADWVRYHTAEPEQANPAFVRRLVDGGAEVLSVSRVPQSLESVYLHLVAEES